MEKLITQIKPQRDQLTKRGIGCCFAVHNSLGPGFPERVYQSALAISLKKAGLAVERERRFPVAFEGQIVGDFHADLLIEQRLIIEVKAVTGAMPKVFDAQLLAYLKAATVPVGLLVNFGNQSCEVKRLVFATTEQVLSAESALRDASSAANLRNRRKSLRSEERRVGKEWRRR